MLPSSQRLLTLLIHMAFWNPEQQEFKSVPVVTYLACHLSSAPSPQADEECYVSNKSDDPKWETRLRPAPPCPTFALVQARAWSSWRVGAIHTALSAPPSSPSDDTQQKKTQNNQRHCTPIGMARTNKQTNKLVILIGDSQGHRGTRTLIHCW